MCWKLNIQLFHCIGDIDPLTQIFCIPINPRITEDRVIFSHPSKNYNDIIFGIIGNRWH